MISSPGSTKAGQTKIQTQTQVSQVINITQCSMALYRYNVFATFMLMFLPDFCSAFQSLLTLNDRVYIGESGWVRAVNQFEFLNYIYVSK